MNDRRFPELTIVIATLNSGKLLPLVLDSINHQTFPSKKIEILIVDGGSTDNTIDIAKSYRCRIFYNEKVFPAYAKYLGFIHARGRYIMFLDSDEVIESKGSIEKKMNVFSRYASVRAVTCSGYKNPEGYHPINSYINEFGDPFSMFLYRISKNYMFFIPSMKKHYKILREDNNCVVFDFSKSKRLPLFELVAMGSVIDLDYLKKNFPEIKKTPSSIVHCFYLLVSKHANIAIAKDDPLIHYSSISYGRYLRKINSRIISNIFTEAYEGFKGRNKFDSGFMKYKKYFFIPYAYSLIPPLFDSFYLAITRRSGYYFIHVILSFYTATLIIFFKFCKLIGYVPLLNSYGQIKQ